MWSIVHFSTDNTVEVVPSHWLKKDGLQCAWPKTTKKSYILRAVINKFKPNKTDFNYFDARCLAKNIDNFSNAQRKCDLAKCRSDISSGTDENKIKTSRRLKKQKQVLINSSSESDREQSDDDDMPSFISDAEHIPITSNLCKKKKTYPDNNDTIKCSNGWSPLKINVNDGEDLLENNLNINVEKETDVLIIENSPTPLIIANEHSQSLFSAARRESPLYNEKSNKSTSSLSYNGAHVYNVTPLKTMNKSTPKMLISENKFDNGSVNMSPLKTSKYTSSSQSHGVKRSLFDDVNKSPKLHKSDSSLTACTPNNSIINDNNFNNFKKSVLHQLLTMKYEMHSINEKLNTIVKLLEDEKKTVSDTEYYEVSQFDKDFPINVYEELIEVETKISEDKTYRTNFVKRLSSVGGKTISIMVKRIMSLVFNPKLLTTFSYNGRGNKKRSFVGLLINKMIFESVFKIKKFAASDNSTNEIEQVLKYVLIQTPFKLKKQEQTANLERSSNT